MPLNLVWSKRMLIFQHSDSSLMSNWQHWKNPFWDTIFSQLYMWKINSARSPVPRAPCPTRLKSERSTAFLILSSASLRCRLKLRMPISTRFWHATFAAHCATSFADLFTRFVTHLIHLSLLQTYIGQGMMLLVIESTLAARTRVDNKCKNVPLHWSFNLFHLKIECHQ